MKRLYILLMAIASIATTQEINAQCNGVKGPNLLGAKGTFSAPFITVNTSADACIQSGANSYSPVGNLGNALAGCSGPVGSSLPCSDYPYVSTSAGLVPEQTYTIVKNLGDENGANCLHPTFFGGEHTGDGGYFMAVNGAATPSQNPVFYNIKSIPVCVGATYEFSAWVRNIIRTVAPGTAPNITFRVNGSDISNSGPINSTEWVKVGGSFVATTNTVDLDVINATFIAGGNDLGVDDISINMCGSNITVNNPPAFCAGSAVTVGFTVVDATSSNKWYQIKRSIDGGATFTNFSFPTQATFTGTSYTVNYNIGVVTSAMTGYKYRLVVATSAPGTSLPDCAFFNEYTLIVPSCGPLPVSLTAFNGKYSNGISTLDWQTSQEVNNKEFQLMRSLDGNNFDVVATIAGTANSTTSKNYQYQDAISGQGFVYYRLRQVDADGRITQSNIIRLGMGGQDNKFQVYPNPFDKAFTASFNAAQGGKATMQLINMKGQVVHSSSISIAKGYNSIQMNNLPEIKSGVYQVVISNDALKFIGRLQKL